jgi:hypothetical protein
VRTLRTYEVTSPNGSVHRVLAGGVVAACAAVGWKPTERGESVKVTEVASKQKYVAVVGEKGLEVRHA